MEQLQRLASLTPLTPLGGEKKADESHPLEESIFGAVFRSAIDNVKETDAEKVEAQTLLATGQLDNPSALMIAASKNQIAVDLLIQLRNKALDVYSELTRFSL